MGNREDESETWQAIEDVTDPQARDAMKCLLNCIRNLREDLESVEEEASRLEAELDRATRDIWRLERNSP